VPGSAPVPYTQLTSRNIALPYQKRFGDLQCKCFGPYTPLHTTGTSLSYRLHNPCDIAHEQWLCVCVCRTVQIRTSTVRYRPTWSCRRTELASGFLRVCFSRPARSISRGFRSMINFVSSSSVRGLTTVSSSNFISTKTALTSPTTFPTANGNSLVGRQHNTYASVFIATTIYHGTSKHFASEVTTLWRNRNVYHY